jgi:TonB family protein
VKLPSDADWTPRKVLSLVGSVGLHGVVVAWVALLPAIQEGPSLYERDIRPNATRIVWYSFEQQLPAISPEEPGEKRPSRALTHAPHTLVAGKQDLLRPPQLVWTPAPPLAKPRMFASPNVVELAPPARPQPRSFVPPPEKRTAPAVAALPAAPELTVSMSARTSPSNLLPPLAAARKTFIPPVEAVHSPASTPANLPAAPTVLETPPEHLAIVSLFPTHSPEIPNPKASQEAGFSTGPQLRSTGGDDVPKQNQLVIPGLLARSATASQSPLVGSLDPPTSLRSLLAATRASTIADTPADMQEGTARPVNQAPDPRLEGRLIYSMALQMPNITSYSGSWIVWFAERGEDSHSHPVRSRAGMRPPVPVRKVDPKYVLAAVQDGVEGKVRLAAVIHKDGRVDAVEVLQSLDARLDRSAAEALAKWEFAPAERNGVPVDVDAVFDIPFHLAPRSAR